MRCLACFSNLINTGQFHCAINPETGREAEMNFSIPTAEKQKVLIAGGGVAGMQAALTCAERGHTVILCEKTDRLGGALRCEEHVPFKEKLDYYLNRQARKVREAGVEIQLNTEVTPDYAESIGADIVIAALGARPVKPPIPGIEGGNALAAEDAYIHPEKIGGTAVILGAGLVGVELAIYLSILGKKISVVEMLGEINHGGNFLHVRALDVEINKYSIDMNFNTTALKITDEGVVCRTPDGERLFTADTVIYAVGQQPLQKEAAALSLCAPDFYPIGDCILPKNIMNATSTAFSVARSVGKKTL